MIDLVTIRERAEKATEGPWITSGVLTEDAGGIAGWNIWGKLSRDAFHKMIGKITCGIHGIWVSKEQSVLNADFITHARTDVPELVEEVERLRTLCELLEKVAERAISTAPYVTATLSSAVADCRRTGADWGKVHGGRAGSSIRQLDGLYAEAQKSLVEEVEK